MAVPLVSIVTPVYNGEKYLRNCIRGVLNQHYENFEYIILDNASTDGTAKIIEEFSVKDDRMKVFRNSATLKIIDNWNESLKYISPDTRWVKYAFADDILFPYCVKEMVRVGEKDPSVGFVSSYHLTGNRVLNVGLPMEQEIADGKQMLKKHILRRLHVCLNSPNTVLYRKSVLDEMNGFDNTFFHADTELALRILGKHNLGFSHQVLTWTGVHKDRGAAYAAYHGLYTKEYLKFAFKDIGKYKCISLTDGEIRQMSEYYADEIARYISAHIVHFNWKDIKSVWSDAPAEVKKRIFTVLRKNWFIYARTLIGSIFHYRERAASRPTFKN